MPLASALPAIVGSLPETTQLIDAKTGRSHDRGAIWSETLSRCRRLLSAGHGSGEPVVVAEPDAVSALLDIFAAWTAGSAAVVVNPALTSEERARVVEATGAQFWLGASPPAGTIALDASGGPGDADQREASSRPLSPDDDALILMTSGTTGQPKGVVHTLRSLSARIALNLQFMASADLARSLNVLPVHFGHGLIGNCLTPLAAGARLSVWSPGVSELHGLGAYLDRERITFMSSVPSLWKVAMRLSEKPAHALKRVHVGSAPLAIEQWEAISDWVGTRRVVNMYGMTEAANWIAGWSLEDGGIADGLVGRAWGGTLGLLGDDGSVRSEGEGEVVFQSPSIMKHYHRQPEKTAAAFRGSWFRSGDTGRIGGDRRLILVGRIKDEINRAGIKIPAEEIDMLLARHPDIVDACAFGIPDAVAGEAVAAAIVLREGTDVKPDGIREWCRERIRADAVPLRLFPMERIPRTDRGKLSRDAVRAAAIGADPAR